MSLEIREVIVADLVLVGWGLLPTREAFERFRSLVDADVTGSGNSISIDSQTGNAEAGRSFELARDRITLDLARDRSIIRKAYPDSDGLSKLAEVASFAIDSTFEDPPSLRALGYNIGLVYELDSNLPATRYIASRIFSANLPHLDDWELAGGSGQITFYDPNSECQWGIRIEPRYNDPETKRVYLNLNLHFDNPAPPQKSEIKDALNLAWKQAHDFARRLDEEG